MSCRIDIEYELVPPPNDLDELIDSLKNSHNHEEPSLSDPAPSME